MNGKFYFSIKTIDEKINKAIAKRIIVNNL